MDLLGRICAKVTQGIFEFSKHAVDQSIERDIEVREVEEAFMGRCELLEDYPDDKYGPSCLILGFTSGGRPLHIQCSYPTRPLVKIITLYEPDPLHWKGFRVRVSPSELRP